MNSASHFFRHMRRLCFASAAIGSSAAIGIHTMPKQQQHKSLTDKFKDEYHSYKLENELKNKQKKIDAVYKLLKNKYEFIEEHDEIHEEKQIEFIHSSSTLDTVYPARCKDDIDPKLIEFVTDIELYMRLQNISADNWALFIEKHSSAYWYSGFWYQSYEDEDAIICGINENENKVHVFGPHIISHTYDPIYRLNDE